MKLRYRPFIRGCGIADGLNARKLFAAAKAEDLTLEDAIRIFQETRKWDGERRLRAAVDNLTRKPLLEEPQLYGADGKKVEPS